MHPGPLVEGRRDERTCLSTRPHWFSVLWHGAPGVGLLAAGMLFGGRLHHLLVSWLPDRTALPGGGAVEATADLPSEVELYAATAFAWGAAVLVLLGSILLGRALLERLFTEYVITITPGFGERIVKVHGVLSRQTVAVPLVMVNDLVVHEPLAGRLLGWGHVDIETGNEYRGDRLEFMPDPKTFYEIWATLLAAGYGCGGGVGSNLSS
jgi:hypothetical protein